MRQIDFLCSELLLIARYPILDFDYICSIRLTTKVIALHVRNIHSNGDHNMYLSGRERESERNAIVV